ncbi:hypothetical protein ACH4TC_09420 [Streptomyces spororaveus]|uniref:hypothetical protein n=1 Tax=Streptomyces spororaveus TaxID=284039 RepID=UPI00378A1857
MGRSPSTVSREIARNSDRDRYRRFRRRGRLHVWAPAQARPKARSAFVERPSR